MRYEKYLWPGTSQKPGEYKSGQDQDPLTLGGGLGEGGGVGQKSLHFPASIRWSLTVGV